MIVFAHMNIMKNIKFHNRKLYDIYLQNNRNADTL